MVAFAAMRPRRETIEDASVGTTRWQVAIFLSEWRRWASFPDYRRGKVSRVPGTRTTQPSNPVETRGQSPEEPIASSCEIPHRIGNGA